MGEAVRLGGGGGGKDYRRRTLSFEAILWQIGYMQLAAATKKNGVRSRPNNSRKKYDANRNLEDNRP